MARVVEALRGVPACGARAVGARLEWGGATLMRARGQRGHGLLALAVARGYAPLCCKMMSFPPGWFERYGVALYTLPSTMIQASSSLSCFATSSSDKTRVVLGLAAIRNLHPAPPA